MRIDLQRPGVSVKQPTKHVLGSRDKLRQRGDSERSAATDGLLVRGVDLWIGRVSLIKRVDDKRACRGSPPWYVSELINSTSDHVVE